ncbi:hypothetical protein DICSQDRAFT_184178 [Dichomitus squalens LYAD-421 SS1]|uniref:C2H2-type domain-containing protein n=1 Tax=Dichomitus squalens (strain LYAD-421) TaxID=732165 RepID=R7SLA3_DICSQ|nr:uncharacterized protein DICSQDRAFT_184178 [Dichomitus squalens LYAD-421 SS1]EJF55812.1 hypothetical protein DICSQDRAFT_184178 [Dichomitus squalens LYAD-421 SS1]
MSTTTFSDWVDMPGSPYASDQALPSLEDASGSIARFDSDIHELSLDWVNLENITCQPDPSFDWDSLIMLSDALPFPPTALSDTFLSQDGIDEPASPRSDWTLVQSPGSSMVPDTKLPPAEDTQIDHLSASSPSPFDSLGFDFGCELFGNFLPPQMYSAPPEAGCNAVSLDGDFGWPVYPLMQHSVGAAGAGATGLATGMDLNVDSAAFSFMAPNLPSFSSPASSPVDDKDDIFVMDENPARAVEEKKDVPVVKKKPALTTRMKRRTDSDDGYSSGDSNASDAPSPRRKRRKQDTTKRYICSFEGCHLAFARTHNLKQHFDSVHEGKRPYGCRELGCERSFSRKHDLHRHHQSEHTDLGSPRNVGNAKKGKANKKSKTIAKKDEHDQ